MAPVNLGRGVSGQTRRKRPRKERTTNPAALKERSVAPKTLTPKRSQLILDFLTLANACPPGADAKTTSARDGWKGELLGKLNKLPYKGRPKSVIRRIDLDYWLTQNGVFSQMVQQLGERLAQPDLRPEPNDDEECTERNSPCDGEKPCTSAQAMKGGGFQGKARIFVQPSPTRYDQVASVHLQTPMSNTADVTQGSQSSSAVIFGNGQETTGQPVNIEPSTSEERVQHFRRIRAHAVGIMTELQELSDGGHHAGNVEVQIGMLSTLLKRFSLDT